MPSFNVEVAHQLGKEKAVSRLEHFADDVRERFKEQISEFKSAWKDEALDFSFETFGMSITGKLTVVEDKAQLVGELPWVAMAFRGKIEGAIREELRRCLEGQGAENSE